MNCSHWIVVFLSLLRANGQKYAIIIFKSIPEVITRFNFNRLFYQAWLKSLIPSNIIAGFKTCGVFPYNPSPIFAPSDDDASNEKSHAQSDDDRNGDRKGSGDEEQSEDEKGSDREESGDVGEPSEEGHDGKGV